MVRLTEGMTTIYTQTQAAGESVLYVSIFSSLPLLTANKGAFTPPSMAPSSIPLTALRGALLVKAAGSLFTHML